MQRRVPAMRHEQAHQPTPESAFDLDRIYDFDRKMVDLLVEVGALPVSALVQAAPVEAALPERPSLVDRSDNPWRRMVFPGVKF